VSFDVYLQAFCQGAPSGIPRHRIREAFGTYVSEKQGDYWQVRYDDLNSCDIVLGAHQGDLAAVESLAIHRPCEDKRLWEALASILALGNVVIYFPGCRAPLIARIEVASHLPAEMIEALGQPIVVKDGAEVLSELRAV
jgi:hypothetical protein